MELLKKYAENLLERDGIYFSAQQSGISYPEEGNAGCFQIEEGSFWFNHRNNCIIEGVKKYSRNEIFFDIGGGNGFVSKGLESNGIRTVLVEPGIQGCLNAKKRSLSNIVCSTLEDASFKHNSISSVGLFDVVEHIEDDHNFLKSINSFLVDGGLVFITVPAYNMLWSDEDVDAGHYRRYTLNKLESVLKKAGFKIKFSTYIFSVLPLPILATRTIPSLLGLRKVKNKLEKHKSDHKRSRGFLGALMDKVWAYEIKAIREERKLYFGGSCFIVAEKRTATSD